MEYELFLMFNYLNNNVLSLSCSIDCLFDLFFSTLDIEFVIENICPKKSFRIIFNKKKSFFLNSWLIFFEVCDSIRF